MGIHKILTKVGFVFLLMIMVVSVKEVALANTGSASLRTLVRVNFRTGPSTSHDIISTLDFGTSLDVVNYDAYGWSIVNYDGKTGYIKSEFIGEDSSFVEPVVQSRSSVELLPWSDVKNIFTIGVPAAVYDVYSGETYYVKSFSNGLHADVEPVTTEDTAIMKRTFGNVWSWSVRPVLVTINGRTIAGSINGMPHGGGVNNSNGMDGQVCIHFLGSTTHNGNKSFAKTHQDVLHTAYNLSK